MTPFKNTKGAVGEGGFRLPCIVRWPGQIRPGVATSPVPTRVPFASTISSPRSSRSPGAAGRKGDHGHALAGQPSPGSVRAHAISSRRVLEYRRSRLRQTAQWVRQRDWLRELRHGERLGDVCAGLHRGERRLPDVLRDHVPQWTDARANRAIRASAPRRAHAGRGGVSGAPTAPADPLARVSPSASATRRGRQSACVQQPRVSLQSATTPRLADDVPSGSARAAAGPTGRIHQRRLTP